MCEICQDEMMDVRLDGLQCAAIALFRELRDAGLEAEAEAVFDRVSEMNVPHHLYWKKIAEALLDLCRRDGAKHLAWQARKVIDRASSFARIHSIREGERRVLRIAEGNADLAGTGRETCGERKEVDQVDYDDLMKRIT